MDASRFDAFSRALVSRLGRRGLLVTVVSGLLAIRSVHEEAGAAKSGKCKRECGECETCKRGDCDKNKHGKKRCKKGKCKPKADGTACTSGACLSGTCVVAAPPPPPPACGTGGPCLTFLTSTQQDGNLGGLDGADAVCQQRAADANLPGTYKAWLSDTTASPSTRFVQSPGPYQLVNGTTIAANWADLIDGQLEAPINVTELGVVVNPPSTPNTTEFAWTHTLATGVAGDGSTPPAHCNDWTSTNPSDPSHHSGAIGDITAAHNAWTEMGSNGCANAMRLYCFQQS